MIFAQLIWLVIALPIIGVLVNGFFGRQMGYKIVRYTGPAPVGLAFLVGVIIFLELGFAEHAHAETVPLWTWAAIGNLEIPVNLLVDPLSVLMVLVVTGVGFLIHIYATGYMVHLDHDGHEHPDRDYTRFFTFLNLFIAAMLILVLGDNYVMMFVGWELVGVSSYFLIGFWYDRGDTEQDPIDIDGLDPVPMAPQLSPAASGMKAFIVNRIGDFGFMLGIFLVWTTFGSVQFSEVFGAVDGVNAGIVNAICLLLFIGAMGKSAQIPLFVWLPDAMAGPTPVSALIHAATMVTAGVYMIVRSHPLYAVADEASLFVAVIGAGTALFAGTIALVQVDLKRILAYSTVSQLGYMFLAVGVGAYAPAMFHLMTHAFFKALLFLGAGSVMHAMQDVIDVRRMGGLKDKMPFTYRTFLIGSLALAGFPLLSGFFSKDEILLYAFDFSPILWFIGIVTAGLTAFYTFRAFFLTFEGTPRDKELYDHAHESSDPMVIVLIILAVLAVIGGVFGLPHFTGLPNGMKDWLYPVLVEGAHAEVHLAVGFEVFLLVVSALVAIGGIFVAYQFFMVDERRPTAIANKYDEYFRTLVGKYYVDEFYDRLFVQPLRRVSDYFYERVDKKVIDGRFVDGLGDFIRRTGQSLSQYQTGYLAQYALATLVGALVVVSYFFLQ